MTIVRSELESLLADLVRIDARNPWLIPGGPGEAAIARHIVERLRPLGVEILMEEVAPERHRGVRDGRGGHVAGLLALRREPHGGCESVTKPDTVDRSGIAAPGRDTSRRCPWRGARGHH